MQVNPSDHHKAMLASLSDRAANSFEVIGRETYSTRKQARDDIFDYIEFEKQQKWKLQGV